MHQPRLIRIDERQRVTVLRGSAQATANGGQRRAIAEKHSTHFAIATRFLVRQSQSPTQKDAGLCDCQDDRTARPLVPSRVVLLHRLHNTLADAALVHINQLIGTRIETPTPFVDRIDNGLLGQALLRHLDDVAVRNGPLNEFLLSLRMVHLDDGNVAFFGDVLRIPDDVSGQCTGSGTN